MHPQARSMWEWSMVVAASISDLSWWLVRENVAVVVTSSDLLWLLSSYTTTETDSWWRPRWRRGKARFYMMAIVQWRKGWSVHVELDSSKNALSHTHFVHSHLQSLSHTLLSYFTHTNTEKYTQRPINFFWKYLTKFHLTCVVFIHHIVPHWLG